MARSLEKKRVKKRNIESFLKRLYLGRIDSDCGHRIRDAVSRAKAYPVVKIGYNFTSNGSLKPKACIIPDFMPLAKHLAVSLTYYLNAIEGYSHGVNRK